jgi:hypothetical protein
MQSGVDKWEAAGFLGMSIEMLDRVYGHHYPDHLRRAAQSLGYRPRQSLAISLATSRRGRPNQNQRIENTGGPGRRAHFQQFQRLALSNLPKGAHRAQKAISAIVQPSIGQQSKQ